VSGHEFTQDYLLDVTASADYAAACEPIEDWSPRGTGIFGGDEVTVGIGVLCQHGTTAVIASDMRAIYPKSAVDPNDLTGKQWDFAVPFPLMACVAGRLGLCQPVIDELSHRLSKLPFDKGIGCEHIENAIRDARFRIFRRYADWCMRASYGMTLREWQRGKVPGGEMSKLIHDEVRSFLDNLSFQVALIVAGFLPDGNMLFYKAEGKNHIEASSTPGIYVIGTGGALAMNHLNKRGQNTDCGIPRTLLHISEALDEARKVPDKSVGKPQAFTLMWRDGRACRFLADAQLLKDWKQAYKNRSNTSSLDVSVIAEQQVKYLLVKHKITLSTSHKSTAAQLPYDAESP